MFESFTGDASRRDVLKASVASVGATMGLVGTASAADDVVEFDESITITPKDSGKTFVQTADFDGEVDIRPGTEDVTVDGNGYTITGSGGVGGGGFDTPNFSNITLQNLHLPDGLIGFSYASGVVVRNNLVKGISMFFGSDLRVVDNTMTGIIDVYENQDGNVFARNVTSGIDLIEDLSGSHRISNNFITGRDRGSGISVSPVNAFEGKLTILGNYIANCEQEGINTEDSGYLNPVISGNVILNNGGDGVNVDYIASMSQNAFIGNEGAGVNAGVGTCTKNVAMSNGGVGFDVGIGDECLRNTAISNGGDGFRIGTGGAKVKFNRSTGNDGNGVVLAGSSFPFRKNNITANGGDGLLINADDSGFSRNRICGNDGEQLVDDGDENRFANNLVC